MDRDKTLTAVFLDPNEVIFVDGFEQMDSNWNTMHCFKRELN
jgi:hypothetical protein